MKRRLRDLTKALPDWDIQSRRGGHLRLVHKTLGCVVIAAKTPSCYLADRNLTAQCKRSVRLAEGGPK